MTRDQARLLLPFIVLGAILGGVVWAAVANRTQTNTVFVIDYINGTVQVESPLGLFGTVNTGHGANELYTMNQDVETTDAVTFGTVDTGQGANELYGMNQGVQTTDDVTFDNVTATQWVNASDVNALDFWRNGGNYTAWIEAQIAAIPDAGGGGAPGDYIYLVNSTGGLATVFNDNGTIVYGPAISNQVPIQWALDSTTLGRTVDERVVVRGAYTLTSPILVPSYTVLDLYAARLTLGDLVNDSMFENKNPTTGDTHIYILGGIFEGNGGEQSVNCQIIKFNNTDNIWVVDGYFTEAKEFSIAFNPNGVYGGQCTRVMVHNCEFYNGFGGIRSDLTWFGVYNQNIFHTLTGYGVLTVSEYSSIYSSNIMYDINQYCFRNEGTYETVFTNNNIAGYGQYGFYGLYPGCVISTNEIDTCENGAIYINGGNGFTIVGNLFNDNGHLTTPQISILSTATRGTITGNRFGAIEDWRGTNDIYLMNVTDIVISGNNFYYQLNDCIDINGADYCLIEGNVFGSVGGDGVHLRGHAEHNVVKDNIFKLVTGNGVEINSTQVLDTVVLSNEFYGITGEYLSDSGTGTIIDNLRVPYVMGTEFDSTGPFGWYINATTEYAATMGKMPDELHRVYKVKVWAVAQNASATGMSINFELYAGGDNEAYTAESVQLANFPCTSVGFAANDIIYWTFTASDDADIADLSAADAWCSKVQHNPAYGDDIETDAVFYCIEIEYV